MFFPQVHSQMIDVIYLALTVAFFGLTALYVMAADRL